MSKPERMLDKIRNDWNAKVGVPMNDNPTVIHQDQGCLMFHLMYEELLEFKEAIANDDIVAIADALGDINYLLKGTINQYGLHEHWKKIENEIHKSNLTKLIDGKLKKREDGKILKSKSYRAPDLTFVKK